MVDISPFLPVLSPIQGKAVVARFDGGPLSSEGGLLALREIERRRILERTERGRADAKAKGVKFGRKPKLTTHQQREAQKRIAAGETQRRVARSYNVSQSTISRLSV
jgi:DNA invertase Pin-like site-specific DNA recombinase